MTEARSPLRGRYLVRNRAWNAWLRASDLMLAALPRQRNPGTTAPPQRLLLAVGGHAGDAVIATSVLEPIRATWPNVEIGAVTGSWNGHVLANHPDIRWIHFADHWKLNRSESSWWARARRSLASHRAALNEIRAVGYDVAIDLYPYYPNSAQLLARASIPTRIGYVSGGGGSHYSRALEWSAGGHVIDDHLRLVAALGMKPVARDAVQYRLPPIAGDVAAAAARKLRDAGGSDVDAYVVLHMGAAMTRKSWPMAKWVEIARAMLGQGLGVVLTGAGADDAARTGALQREVAAAVDLCDRLTWDEFRHVVALARTVICVDTVAGHVAAAENTAAVVIMTGMDHSARWNPHGESVTVLTHPVPCAPCYRSDGCPAMSCVREVTTQSVLSAARVHLGAQHLRA
jgi:ADP-heptose:LPS heptosyltransferase